VATIPIAERNARLGITASWLAGEAAGLQHGHHVVARTRSPRSGGSGRAVSRTGGYRIVIQSERHAGLPMLSAFVSALRRMEVTFDSAPLRAGLSFVARVGSFCGFFYAARNDRSRRRLAPRPLAQRHPDA